MKLKTKAIWTFIILCVYGILESVLTPVASLLSNQVTINQLSNSDAASLAVTAVGKGSGPVTTILTIVAVFFLVLIWARKTKVEPSTPPSEPK